MALQVGSSPSRSLTSRLHIHPVSNSQRELGGKDDEISVISSEQGKKIYKKSFGFITGTQDKKQSAKEGWHSDITFEPVPSDYVILRLTELPKTGGGAYCPPISFLKSLSPFSSRVPTLQSFHSQASKWMSRDG